MSKLIQLLPDAVVNQIAAGEVIQRPASVVKELMDNAIDSGATSIKLIVKESGKTLIQVNDNGSGMSPLDARMCFERHATSKIRSADDLFKIQTMGFRGEALASIAAVSQVELRTKRAEDELGTKILISDSKIKAQEPCSCPTGTQVIVQHLFYSVPARKKFLKTDTVELRHIHDEFVHQALANPHIQYSYFNNDQEVYNLSSGSLKNRIVAIFGKRYSDEILPVEQETDLLQIRGFVGKPEIAKKSRGEQYLFVNGRYFKSHYLLHAAQSAYEELIAEGLYPFTILFIDIDPAQIDINVHPTKHEIKFEEERLIYNFLKVAVKHAIGKFTITPQLDFENSNPGVDILISQNSAFSNQHNATKTNYPSPQTGSRVSWEDLAFPKQTYQDLQANTKPFQDLENSLLTGEIDRKVKAIQIHNSYIVFQSSAGFVVIDQQSAHERILYEQNKRMIQSKSAIHQKLLFPETLHLSGPDAKLMEEILPALNDLGFTIEAFGGESFIIYGGPSFLNGKQNEKELALQVLEQYKMNLEFELGIEESISRSLAISSANKRGVPLQDEEIQYLVEQLFACEIPFTSPSGHKCYLSLSLEEIQAKLF